MSDLQTDTYNDHLNHAMQTNFDYAHAITRHNVGMMFCKSMHSQAYAIDNAILEDIIKY